MNNGNVVVFGSKGQLGQSLQSVTNLEKNNYNFVFLAREESDITNIVLLENIFKKYKPKYVVNCAAYTQVDLAEDFKEEAFEINVSGTKNIAELCKDYSATLIHISTDFVFEGEKATLKNEKSLCNPINYYGLSKLLGEKEIEKILKEYFIIRTSWLYSEFGNNFVKTMLRLAKEREELNIINDQIGSPTYAIDLAKFLITIIKQKSRNFGVYHYSNEGVCSWYDFAVSIFEYAKVSTKVSPITSLKYQTKAIRPKFSVMSKEKVKSNFNIEINHWRSSLKECLNKIK